MKITLTKTPEIESKGKYDQMTVSYDNDGKQSQKKLMSFLNKDVYELLKSAQAGSSFEVKLEKDGKYWNWVGIDSLGTSEYTPRSNAKTGNWETAEERALKQVYIVRQSSISNAIEYFKLVDHRLGTEDMVSSVIDVAKQFEQYVFSKQEPEVV